LAKQKNIGSPKLAYYLYLLLEHRYLSYKQFAKLDSLKREEKKKTDVRISQIIGNKPSQNLIANGVIEKVSVGKNTILWAGSNCKNLVSQYQKQLEEDYLDRAFDLSYFNFPKGILDPNKREEKAKKDNSTHELAIRDFLISLKEQGIDYHLYFERIQIDGDKEIRPDATALLKKGDKYLFIYVEVDCGTEDTEKIKDKYDRYKKLLKINNECLVYERVYHEYCPIFDKKTPRLEDLGVRVYFVYTGSSARLKRIIQESGSFRIAGLGENGIC